MERPQDRDDSFKGSSGEEQVRRGGAAGTNGVDGRKRRVDLPERAADELTIEEAALRTHRSVDEITAMIKRRDLPYRTVRGPRRGSRVVPLGALDEQGLIEPERPPTLFAIAGLLVEQRRDAVSVEDAAFVLDETDDVVNKLVVRGELSATPEHDDRRIPVSALAAHPKVAQDELAQLYLLRLAEGSIELSQPGKSRPKGHIEGLRILK